MAAVLPFDLYVDNDNLISVSSLRNSTAATGVFINNATVAVTLLDSAGAEVAGETWPLTLGYVTASDGGYRAVMQDTLTIVPGSDYTAEITADGDGLQAAWSVAIVGATRTI